MLFSGNVFKRIKVATTAVVGRQDASELNFMIDVIMERHGIRAGLTAKQSSKDIARGGRTRHSN